MLLLPKGQMSEAWEHFTKQFPFGKNKQLNRFSGELF
jgi:hypothetical protein